MATEDSTKLHIAMFPWLAFGHMIPYLELAKLIALKGHKISFISTPTNIDRLPILPPNLSSSIQFIKLPLPRIENLPEKAEATIDLPYAKVPYLKIAFDGLRDPIAKFLETSSLDWLLFDFVPYWLPPLAHNLGIPIAFFSIFNAASVAYISKPSSPFMADIKDDRKKPEDFTKPPRWFPFPSSVAFRLFEILKIFDSLTGTGVGDNDIASQPSDMYRAAKVLERCDAMVIRSCWELEPDYLNLLKELHHKPILPIGLPFFCVLRTRQGVSDTESIELPEGFQERNKGRGVVWTSWVPQPKILAHDSVGGFLSHAGWSSIVEAITFQRALILLTFLADQGLNARVLEDKKLGYAVPRNEKDGTFTRDSVAESLRLVIVDEAGQVYRENVKQVKEDIFGDPERHDRYVDQFLSFLIENKNLLSHPKPYV